MNHIAQTKDLGFKGSSQLKSREIIQLEGSDSTLGMKKDWIDFLKILKVADVNPTNVMDIKVCDDGLGDENDDAYETERISLNCVFIVEGDQLRLAQNFSFCQPKHSFLKDDSVCMQRLTQLNILMHDK